MSYNNLNTIYEQLICTICGDISLLEANIPIASELKDIINALDSKGFNEEEIISYMLKNYSEFIYLNAPQSFNFFYILLWFFPVLVSIFFAYIILRIYNKKSVPDDQLNLPFE